MPITALYASLLVPLYIYLAVRVIRVRFRAHVSVGDGGDKSLLRRMRVHANFAEYVPVALILMGLAESLGLDARALHGAGVTLLLGRAAHAYGMSQEKDILPLRSAGVVATFSGTRRTRRELFLSLAASRLRTLMVVFRSARISAPALFLSLAKYDARGRGLFPPSPWPAPWWKAPCGFRRARAAAPR